MRLKYLLILFFLATFISVSAHQPRLTFDQQLDKNPYVIKNPEISQAFYGELKGNPEYYVINSEDEFDLYVQVLSPDIENARKDFIVEVFYNSTIIQTLEGKNREWTLFYEEFAGDSYFEGPNFEQKALPGVYIMKVYNDNDIGKYVLVVGKKESFPLDETINTYLSLPRLKRYFEKSVFVSYFNLVGLFLLVFLIVLFLIVFGIVYFVRKKKNKRKI